MLGSRGLKASRLDLWRTGMLNRALLILAYLALGGLWTWTVTMAAEYVIGSAPTAQQPRQPR